MANVTGTTADKFIDEIWSSELNRAVEFRLVIAALFSDWTSRMRGSGDVFHLPARQTVVCIGVLTGPETSLVRRPTSHALLNRFPPRVGHTASEAA